MKENKVFYLCNRTKCQNCEYPTCKHTASIFYASHFIFKNGQFWEKNIDIDFKENDLNSLIRQSKHNAYLDTILLIKKTKSEYLYGMNNKKVIKVLDELENKINELRK